MIEATITRKKGDTITLCAESWEQIFKLLCDFDFISLKAKEIREKKGVGLTLSCIISAPIGMRSRLCGAA